MGEIKEFSIAIKDENDIDVDALYKELLLMPAELYLRLFRKMKRSLYPDDGVCYRIDEGVGGVLKERTIMKKKENK